MCFLGYVRYWIECISMLLTCPSTIPYVCKRYFIKGPILHPSLLINRHFWGFNSSIFWRSHHNLSFHFISYNSIFLHHLLINLQSAVGCLWVYTLHVGLHGQIDHLKAHLETRVIHNFLSWLWWYLLSNGQDCFCLLFYPWLLFGC